MKIVYGIVLHLISLATGLFGIANETVSQIYSTVTTEVVLISSSDIIEYLTMLLMNTGITSPP